MLIVLLGKTGHGKSATGNTLLGTEIFNSISTPCTLTCWTERSSAIYNGINVDVVDTPGVFSTEFNSEAYFKYPFEIIDNLMNSLCSSEINAFCFVYNITIRYVDEERHAISIFKHIFGPRAITNFGVLIFTHGDIFNINFEDWLAQQTGSLRELIDEFNGRVILISNNSDYQEMRTESRKRMIDLVQSMRKDCFYTIRDYEVLKNDRDFFIFTKRIPEIRSKYQRKINYLTNSVNRSSTLKKEEADEFCVIINNLQREIKEKSLGTNRLDDEQQQLEQLKIIVSAKTASCALL